MKKIIWFFLFAFHISASFSICRSSDAVEALIDNIGRNGLLQLTEKGIIIESVRGNSARVSLSPDQYDELTRSGYSVRIVPADRRSRNTDGYHTYESLTSALKSVEAAHPDICRLMSAGKSYRGRELWFMKITDNPDIEEDEPEFKYISTMHGDEPVGMELCVSLIRHLTDLYGVDERLTHLVNSIEIWIMPLMNPDGLAGGMRRNDQGADLNRSFPDRVKDPVNTADGRPVEVQHIMNWQFDHSPVLSANFHSGALLVNYPFDSDPDVSVSYSASPDDDLFIRMALTYASANPPMYCNSEFKNGISNGVDWYTVYGGMQDWNYIRTGCKEVTIELSNEKQPPFSEISELWEDNRESMLAYMEWSLKGVRGLVTDSRTGKPLPAAVRIAGRDHTAYTDPDVGDYHRILLPGTYTLEISSEGYAAKRIENVAVFPDAATRLDVQLSFPEYTDINRDGATDLSDLVAVLRILVSDAAEPLSANLNAVKNSYRRIGIEDAVMILHHIAAGGTDK